MIKRILLGTAAAAVFALLAACGGDDNAATTTPTKITGTSSLAPTATVAATTQALATTGALTSSKFEVPVSLTPAAGFTIDPRADVTHNFGLNRPPSGSTRGGYLVFMTPTNVIDNGKSANVPVDLVAWLQNHPDVDVVAGPKDVTVDGISGKQLDVRGSGLGGLHILGVAAGEEAAHFLLAAGEPARIIVVQVNGKTVLIAGGPFDQSGFSPEAFAALTPEIDGMIASINFKTN
jgi:hypothetical protein